MIRTTNDSFAITFTSIPSGIVNSNKAKQLRLKVLVAPRFADNDTSRDIGKRILRDWPEILRSGKLKLKVMFAVGEDNQFVANRDGELNLSQLVSSSQWKRAFPILEVRDGEKVLQPLNVTEGFASSYNAVAVQSELRSRRLLKTYYDLNKALVREMDLNASQKSKATVEILALKELVEKSIASMAWGNSTTLYGNFAIPTFEDDYNGKIFTRDITPEQEKLKRRNDYRLSLDGNVGTYSARSKDGDAIVSTPRDTTFRYTFENVNTVAFFQSAGTAEATTMHSRAQTVKSSENDEGLPSSPPPDLAERIALVMNKPNLAQRLGLLLDVRIDLDSLLTDRTISGAIGTDISKLRVWVEPEFNDSSLPGFNFVLPSTRCDLNPSLNLFCAAELTPDGTDKDPHHTNGHLLITKKVNDCPLWALTTMDLDGGAIKTFNNAIGKNETPPRFVTDGQGHILQCSESASNLLTKGKANSFKAGVSLASFLNSSDVHEVINTLKSVGLPKRRLQKEIRIVSSGRTDFPDVAIFSVHLECFESGDEALYVWNLVPKNVSFNMSEMLESDDSADVIAHRSTGLSLVRSNANVDIIKAEQRFKKLSDNDGLAGQPVLVASDLVLGYVPEIWAPPSRDPNGKPSWHSTTERTEQYPLLDEAIRSEGYVNVGVAQVSDAAPKDQGKLDRPKQGTVSPTLFTYGNFSLGAPNQFNMARPLPSDFSGNSRTQPDEDPLHAKLTPIPKSLPLVRYSHVSKSPFTYHVRCRVMDIAGNTRRLPAETLGDQKLYLGTHVTREEPAQPPVLLSNGPLNLASNPGVTVDRMVARDAICDTRILVPPRVSPDVLLRYGKGIGRDLSSCHFASIQLDSYADIPEAEAIQPAGSKQPSLSKQPKIKTPVYRVPSSDIRRQGFYYFPDPVCKYIALALNTFCGQAYNLPTIRLLIPFYTANTWPNARPIAVDLCRLPASEVNPIMEVRNGRVQIFLPEGWTGWLEVSSSIDRNDYGPEHFSVLDDFRSMRKVLFSRASSSLEKLDRSSSINTLEDLFSKQSPRAFSALGIPIPNISPNRDLLQVLATSALPSVTPPQRINLVCPTRTPLSRPTLKINGFSSSIDIGSDPREPNEEIVRLAIESMIDEKSTSEVSLMASWKRLEDDPAKGDPRCVRDRTEVMAGEKLEKQPVKYEPTKIEWTKTLDLGTTKYRKVRYRINGLSRFTSFYSETRRELFISNGTNEVVIKHLNCARPLRLPVEFLVPTLTWTSQVEPLIHKPSWRFLSSARNGIRVYLGRGWELGELLGVVLHPTLSEHDLKELSHGQPVNRRRQATDKLQAVPIELQDAVTQWGADPIVDSNIPKDLPSAHDFIGYRHVGGNLLLPTMDDKGVPRFDDKGESIPLDPAAAKRLVSVLGFRPKWHPRKKLWYCDIGLKRIPSYGCFFRLSLVRYQPNSIAGMELSAPVIADYIQLRPGRTISIIRDPHDKENKTLKITITEAAEEGRTKMLQSSVPGGNTGIRNRFKLHVEQPVATTRIAEMGWMRDEDIKCNEDTAKSSEVLWSGKLVWPKPSGRRRLVIREFEEWHTEQTSLEFDENNTGNQPRRREVFCNVLEI